MREGRGKLVCGSGPKGNFFLAWLDGNPATGQSHLAPSWGCGVDLSAPSAMSMTRQRRSAIGAGMLVQVVGHTLSWIVQTQLSIARLPPLSSIPCSRYYCGTSPKQLLSLALFQQPEAQTESPPHPLTVTGSWALTSVWLPPSFG